jgi:hypothetical protein
MLQFTAARNRRSTFGMRVVDAAGAGLRSHLAQGLL